MHDPRGSALRRNKRFMNQPRVMRFIERIDPISTVPCWMAVLWCAGDGLKTLTILDQNARAACSTELVSQILPYAARIGEDQPRLASRVFTGSDLERFFAPGDLIQPPTG